MGSAWFFALVFLDSVEVDASHPWQILWNDGARFHLRGTVNTLTDTFGTQKSHVPFKIFLSTHRMLHSGMYKQLHYFFELLFSKTLLAISLGHPSWPPIDSKNITFKIYVVPWPTIYKFSSWLLTSHMEWIISTRWLEQSDAPIVLCQKSCKDDLLRGMFQKSWIGFVCGWLQGCGVGVEHIVQ